MGPDKQQRRQHGEKLPDLSSSSMDGLPAFDLNGGSSAEFGLPSVGGQDQQHLESLFLQKLAHIGANIPSALRTILLSDNYRETQDYVGRISSCTDVGERQSLGLLLHVSKIIDICSRPGQGKDSSQAIDDYKKLFPGDNIFARQLKQDLEIISDRIPSYENGHFTEFESGIKKAFENSTAPDFQSRIKDVWRTLLLLDSQDSLQRRIKIAEIMIAYLALKKGLVTFKEKFNKLQKQERERDSTIVED